MVLLRARRAATVSAACLALVASVLTGTALADPYGPDVSSNNHPNSTLDACGQPIDWSSVAGEPDQQFVMIKATEDTSYVNPCMQSDAQAARAAGLLVGFYHFAHPYESATAQADFFANAIGPVTSGELPPALDLEITGDFSGDPTHQLNPAQMQAWTQQFLTRLQTDTGRVPMIYTSPNFWNNSVGSPSFGGYPLWLADYTRNPFAPPDAWPAGWSSFALWQYTDNATIPGIPGSTDRNTDCCGPASLAHLAQVQPNQLFIDSLATDTTGGLLPIAQSQADLAALNNGSLTRLALAGQLVDSPAYAAVVVQAGYQAVLNRAPDPGGLATWSGVLERGASPEQLYADLAASTEFYQRGGGTTSGFVSSIYQHLFQRPADPGGLAAWSSLVDHGTPRYDMAISFMQSQEGRVDQVNAAYQQVLHRPADSGGLATWTGVMLVNGGSVTGIVQDLLGSQEYFNDAQARGI